MSLRRLIAYALSFLIAAVILSAALWVAPLMLARPDVWRTAWGPVALGAGLALVLTGVFVGVEQLFRVKLPAQEHPENLIDDFNRRTLGVVDEVTLAQATGDLAAERFQARASGWLLLTPRETTLAVQPLAGRGDFPTQAFEVSRQNALMRQLNDRRVPVRHTEVAADAQYQQMPAAERQWLKQLRGAVYAPVFDAGVLTAIWVVGARDSRHPYRPRELEALALLAAQTGAAWKIARLQGEARQLQETAADLERRLREKDVAVTTMDSSRSDFLAIASHELRTPITQLLGFADLLGSMAQDNSLDLETVVQVTDSIVRACGRLNEVISQIMDMAQLDVNALDLKFSLVTLDAVLRQAVEPYVTALKERQLALKITGLKGLPALQADEYRLVQAFSQLMSNAIKFTPDGGKVEISLRLLPPENNLPPNVEIVFADSGIGIDPQYHPLIFDKFYRIGSASQHSTSTTKFMGAGPGLGLPIAKGVVERHGGRLWVESPGCDPVNLPGSRFIVRLPLKPPAFDPRALAASEGLVTDPGERPKDSRANILRNPFVDG